MDFRMTPDASYPQPHHLPGMPPPRPAEEERPGGARPIGRRLGPEAAAFIRDQFEPWTTTVLVAYFMPRGPRDHPLEVADWLRRKVRSGTRVVGPQRLVYPGYSPIPALVVLNRTRAEYLRPIEAILLADEHVLGVVRFADKETAAAALDAPPDPSKFSPRRS